MTANFTYLCICLQVYEAQEQAFTLAEDAYKAQVQIEMHKMTLKLVCNFYQECKAKISFGFDKATSFIKFFKDVSMNDVMYMLCIKMLKLYNKKLYGLRVFKCYY